MYIHDDLFYIIMQGFHRPEKIMVARKIVLL